MFDRDIKQVYKGVYQNVVVQEVASKLQLTCQKQE
jgi:hypothetical protein